MVIQQDSTTVIQQVKCESKLTTKTATTKNASGPYRSYSSVQIQKLLDLVIEQGMSARQTWLIVGIVVITAQHHEKLYKGDEEKHLPDTKKLLRFCGRQEMHCFLLFRIWSQSVFLVFISISFSMHLLPLKKLDTTVAVRMSESTLINEGRKCWSGWGVREWIDIAIAFLLMTY